MRRVCCICQRQNENNTWEFKEEGKELLGKRHVLCPDCHIRMVSAVIKKQREPVDLAVKRVVHG